MNSVLEYVRQLNQQSVTLRNEWLDRLRHVECEPGVFSLTPEICLTKRPALRSSDSSIHSAPITVVPPGPFGFGQQDKADKITRQSAIDAKSAAPESASIDSANQSFCPMDRLRELPCDELHVAGAAWGDLANPVLPIRRSPSTDLNFLGANKPDFCERHSFVPLPHAPISETKAGLSHEVEPQFDDYQDSSQSTTVSQEPGSQVENVAENPWNTAAAPTVATLHGSLTTFSESATSPGDGQPGFPDTNIPVDSSRNQMDAKPVDELSTSLPQTFDKIAEQLLARFPIVSSATVMYASLNPGIDVDTVAAKVATCLANRDLGGILLIDGNTSSRELSNLMGTTRSPGLMELVNQTDTLSNVVCSTDNGNLAFLPYGNGDFTHRRFDAIRATALGEEFNEAFQYTIVSGGVVDNSLVQRWSGFVDAVYLLIDLGCADRQKTIESLAALRYQAVRIAGIITVAKQ